MLPPLESNYIAQIPSMNSPTEGVDKVRRAEHRRLARKGDYRLAGSRYLCLTGQQRLAARRKERFENACGDHLENRECGGMQRVAARLLGSTRCEIRNGIHPGLVPPSGSHLTDSDEEGGCDNPGALSLRGQLLHPRYHQCSGQCDQQQDHVKQTATWTPSKTQEFKNSHRLLLRSTRSSLTIIPDRPPFLDYF
jgi:hypothetical protein